MKQENGKLIPEVGLKLKQLRKEKKLSLDAVAKILKTSRSYVWYVEQGTKHFSVERLEQFCSLFNVSADWLLGIKKDKQSEIKAGDLFQYNGIMKIHVQHFSQETSKFYCATIDIFGFLNTCWLTEESLREYTYLGRAKHPLSTIFEVE